MSSYAEESHWDRIRSPVLDLVYLGQVLTRILPARALLERGAPAYT